MIGSSNSVRVIAQGGPPSAPFAVAVFVAALIVLILVGVIISFLRTWMTALAAGVPVSFGQLIGMRLRKVPAGRIVDALITARRAGAEGVTLEKLELHHLAGGNVTRVCQALAAARQADMPLTFEHAAAIDLDGRDVLAEVVHVRNGAAVESRNEADRIGLVHTGTTDRGRF
jgi:uncharacterized protein YqfA (UPF0365 family)